MKRLTPLLLVGPFLQRQRFRFFGIKYIDMNNTLETVKDAVKKELNGQGKLLGYRALTRETAN